MRQLLSVICAAVFAANLGATDLASTDEPAMSKREFAEYCTSVSQSSSQADTVSDEEADRLLLQYVIRAGGEDREELEGQLNEAGIFLYSDGSRRLLASQSPAQGAGLDEVLYSFAYGIKQQMTQLICK